MSKNTPGPWSVHVDEKGRGYEIVSPRGGERESREICRINSRRRGAGRGGAVSYSPHPEDLANANLLAAAPELADALEAWVQSTDASEQTGSMRPVLEAARAALRKAGRQS